MFSCKENGIYKKMAVQTKGKVTTKLARSLGLRPWFFFPIFQKANKVTNSPSNDSCKIATVVKYCIFFWTEVNAQLIVSQQENV